MIDALWTIRVGMLSERARNTMSVCVVALVTKVSMPSTTMRDEFLPVRVANNEQGDILFIRVAEDLVTLGLDHVAICYDQLFPIECFLA